MEKLGGAPGNWGGGGGRRDSIPAKVLLTVLLG